MDGRWTPGRVYLLLSVIAKAMDPLKSCACFMVMIWGWGGPMRVLWEKGTSVEEWPPSGWPARKSIGHFLD